jgi:hypothetical protein
MTRLGQLVELSEAVTRELKAVLAEPKLVQSGVVKSFASWSW